MFDRCPSSSSILPLLNNGNNGQHQTTATRYSRQRAYPPQLLGQVVRFLTRRRLKFYLCASALILIAIITILHRISVTENKRHLHGDLVPSSRLVARGRHNSFDPNRRARFEANTIRTIIGNYVGPKFDTLTSANLSDEVLNTNNYDPDPSLGANGRPVYLEGYPKDRIQLLYSINRFNLVASDKISVDRKLPDPRKLTCRREKFDLTRLGNTSVIIVFHNEAWSTLVRTVHSILNTSPQHLLAEILLVDDASNRTFLGKSLEYYMNNLGSIRGVSIRILRSVERVGLIKSRLIGVREAVGKILTFIDAHCEATSGWLEPLLEQVNLDRTTAACPIIDIINEDNFAFTRSFELHLGAFNWGLNFRWYPISKRELTSSISKKRNTKSGASAAELVQPFHTPVMAGGLFSIDRDYFLEIGQYDNRMDIWGGENIELSFRLWQCGGKVKIVPCSHVAHIFRKSSPYTFRPNKEVGDILYTNLARVAEVWMDDWRNFFYLINPIVNRTLAKVGREFAFKDIDLRQKLRRDLNCKSFKWFLDNVWPEHFFPDEGRFFGQIKQLNSSRCLQRPSGRQTSGHAPVGPPTTSSNCSAAASQHQLFVFDSKRNYLMTDENVCLDSGSSPIPSRQVILAPCSETKRQKWEHTSELQLKHISSGLCLDSPKAERVQLEDCGSLQRGPSLKWEFIERDWRGNGSK